MVQAAAAKVTKPQPVDRRSKGSPKALPRPGEYVYVTIRSKVIKIGPERTTLEFVELQEGGAVAEPVFASVPTALIEVEQQELRNLHNEVTKDPAWQQ